MKNGTVLFILSYAPWSRGLPGCFKDTARGYLFCNGCNECSDGRDHFREIVWGIKKNQDGSRKYNLV